MSVPLKPRPDTGSTLSARTPGWSPTRVVLASLAVGILAAVVLTLVVVPGATEPVVTGSLLVGFGLGWAALAVLSARRTGTEQRWARVPAVAMAVTGAALVLLEPGEAALTALGWFWPPLLLALATWTAIRSRRSLPARAWWLLVPVFLTLVLASLGALVQDVTGPQVRRDHPAPGRIYAVHGHQMHLDCTGTGRPTVVLVNGLGELSASWARVAAGVLDTTRVCAYDRPGQAWSDEVDHPQDGVDAAADLHALLRAAGEPGPYVIVGHSIGGPYALTYAHRYAEDVVGMVLLDSSSPRQFEDQPAYPLQYAMMRRGIALMPILARIGLGRLSAASSSLPGHAGEVVNAMTSTVRAQRNGRDELSTLPRTFEESRSLTTLDTRPLVVLTASENLGTDGWPEAQRRLAALSSNAVQRDVRSSHAGLVDDHGSATSIDAITAVVRSVRTGDPVSMP